MSSRTGLGDLEVAVLAAVGRRKRSHHTTDALRILEQENGIGARYAYPILQDLGVPWRLHLPLLVPNGNWGSQHGDPAAEARYTEVKLSAVGALALAAERAEVGPIPLGLVEGSLYRDGPVPPFAPRRVLEALRNGDADAGPPVMPTGGTVGGDVAGLLAGHRARLDLGCTLVEEPGHIVITEVPLGVDIDEICRQLHQAASAGGRRRHADYLDPAGTPLFIPISDVRDESDRRRGIRVVCVLDPDEEVDAAARWIRAIWPVTIQVDCQLPAPMAKRLATWELGDGSGVTALEALL